MAIEGILLTMVDFRTNYARDIASRVHTTYVLLILLYREEDMKMSENNDYIQLPPLKKDTPSDVVTYMWEYMEITGELKRKS